MNVLVSPVILLGAIGAVSAVLLSITARFFKVHEDPRIDSIAEMLPGANCGGCGYPGCRGLAEALAKGADKKDISALKCPPGGNDTMNKIAAYLGMTAAQTEPTIAVLRCYGTLSAAPSKYRFDGPKSCAVENMLFSGESGCGYGCVGNGDCAAACTFGAITLSPVTGLPEVDPLKCTSCGKCVTACPRNLFEIRTRGKKDRRVWISCRNTEKGGFARKNCASACIGCGACVKACPEQFSAITMQNNLAYIDSIKCKRCGKCISVCPTHAVKATFEPPKKEENL